MEINTVSLFFFGFRTPRVQSSLPVFIPCFCCGVKLNGGLANRDRKSDFALSEAWAIALRILKMYFNSLLLMWLRLKALSSPTSFLALLSRVSKSCHVLKLSGWSKCSVTLLANNIADCFDLNFFTLLCNTLSGFSAISRINNCLQNSSHFVHIDKYNPLAIFMSFREVENFIFTRVVKNLSKCFTGVLDGV